MIERDAFAREMGSLADRFGRDVSRDMARRYFAFLSPHMTTEQFVQAASVIYAHDRFWPPPARFLEAVGADPATRASSAWEDVMSLVRNGGGLNPGKVDDPALAAALRAVGGTARLSLAHEDRLTWIRREFVAAYRADAEGSTTQQALTGPTIGELTE